MTILTMRVLVCGCEKRREEKGSMFQNCHNWLIWFSPFISSVIFPRAQLRDLGKDKTSSIFSEVLGSQEVAQTTS